MKDWSAADPSELYHYYLNFGAVDASTGNLIESNDFTMNLSTGGYTKILKADVNITASYSKVNERGVFKKVPWRPLVDYTLKVNRVPADYKLPTGTAKFTISQGYPHIPQKLAKVIDGVGKAISSVCPAVKAAKLAVDFLLKIGMPSNITNSGNMQAAMKSSDMPFWTPWEVKRCSTCS